MDERLVTKLCLIGSALSIAVIYLLLIQMEYRTVNVGDVTAELAGSSVNVTGYVSSIYFHKSGHVFFNLIDGEDKVRVVIWENIAEQLGYSGLDATKIKNGDSIQIVGTVELYQGEPEIIPVKAQVRLLG